jgi:hypothetical protein
MPERASWANLAAYLAIILCSSSLALSRLLAVDLLSKLPIPSKCEVKLLPSGKPLWEGIGEGGTMWERLRVFSGCSGNRGRLFFCLSGTHRKDFLSDCPIVLLGD